MAQHFGNTAEKLIRVHSDPIAVHVLVMSLSRSKIKIMGDIFEMNKIVYFVNNKIIPGSFLSSCYQ